MAHICASTEAHLRQELDFAVAGSRPDQQAPKGLCVHMHISCCAKPKWMQSKLLAMVTWRYTCYEW